MQIKKSDFFLIPNLLTYLRILFLPLIFYLLTQKGKTPLIVVVFLGILFVLIDVLDGFLARRLNQVSDLGKILDPITDKSCMIVFLIFVIIHRDFPLWAAIAVVFKEFFLLFAGMWLVKKTKYVPSSDNWGKANSWCWAFVILFYILRLKPYKEILLGLALILLFFSMVDYLNRYRKIFKQAHQV
jgi:CDP-diacylglycerol--glycerol-3-phosphate 3-phosphatidyltransferase